MVVVKASSSPATKEVEAVFLFRIESGALAGRRSCEENQDLHAQRGRRQIDWRRLTGKTEIRGNAASEETTGKCEDLLRE